MDEHHAFIPTLETQNWDEALDQLNINEAWDYFYGVLIKECVPVSRSRNRKNIYITREAIKLKNAKNRLWRRYSSTGDPMDHAAFASTRNALRALTRKLRKTFEESITKNIKANPKAFWKCSKSRLKTHSTINALINPDGNIVHSDTLKVEISLLVCLPMKTSPPCRFSLWMQQCLLFLM